MHCLSNDEFSKLKLHKRNTLNYISNKGYKYKCRVLMVELNIIIFINENSHLVSIELDEGGGEPEVLSTHKAFGQPLFLCFASSILDRTLWLTFQVDEFSGIIRRTPRYSAV